MLFALLVAAVARADGEPSRATLEQAAQGVGDAAAEALFLLGQLDEQDFELARALAHYKDSYARSPSNRYAQRATNRASQLEARSEGDFAPLVRLERVRRDPTLANDAAAIDTLARAAEAFPPGLVRVEAWMFIAEAYLGRMNRHADAIVLLRRVVVDPKVDPLTARQAAHQIVDTMSQDGEIDRAVEAAHELRSRLDPSFVTSIERRVRRRTLRRIAIADLAAIGALSAIALVLAKRRARLDAVKKAFRASIPVAFLFAAYIALAGGYLASSYEAGNAKPFLWFGLVVAPIVLIARAWGAAGSPSSGARIARGFACGSATIAAAFIVLERLDPAYLEGFGL